ncbi:MAG: fluoride efflux transporter CrcB [Hyphomicrobiales bacterium]|nr:fluoride efflux transporter CrcB [Hyphomicrobiales bacterium]MDE2115263.1 fluoride efflux transporter CrcB [Hyphomicrobiales bacterium]
MQSILLVFFGAGIGGVLRLFTYQIWARWIGPNANFPYATFTANVIGSFVMGVLIAWFAFRSHLSWSAPTRIFMTTGILGGYTTFSTFSLDAGLLIEKHEMGIAAVYVLTSVVISIAALFAGMALVRTIS